MQTNRPTPGAQPSVRDPAAKPVPKRLASLIFNYVRARTLRTEWQKEDERLRRRLRAMEPGAVLSLGDLGRGLTFYSLWLACLQVVVEGYDRSYRDPQSLLHDATIEHILADQARVRQLRKYRNAIFHPELYDHADASAVHRQYKEFGKWAGMLTDEFERLFTERLDMDEVG